MGVELIIGALFVGMVLEHPASKNSKINNIIEENVFILVVLFIKIYLINNFFYYNRHILFFLGVLGSGFTGSQKIKRRM